MVKRRNKKKTFWQEFANQKYLMMIVIPCIIYMFIFHYVPIWGWAMAFFKFTPGKSLIDGPFVGFDNFIQLFNDSSFYLVFRNTMVMNFAALIFGTLCAVVFALLLNEVAVSEVKRTIQTISYLPHFVSWVIVAGLFYTFLSTNKGAPINYLLLKLNIVDNPIPFFMKEKLFWYIATIANLWKETGWTAILYLAAITGIDPMLYEAAIIDGANRFKRIWHITLPGIRSTVIVLGVLQIGWVMNMGFDKSFLMGNGVVANYSDNIPVYAYRYGIQQGNFSYGTTIGIFQSVIGIAMIITANYIAKKLDERVF